MKRLPNLQCAAWDHDHLAGLRAGISSDVRHYLVNYPEFAGRWMPLKLFLSVFLTPEILCVSLYRLAHYLYLNGWRRLAFGVSLCNFLMHKASLAPQACIGPGCHIPHPGGVVFCGTAGRDLALYSTAVCTPDERFADGPAEAGPQLGDRVTVGAHATVLGPVRVGDDTSIGFSVRLTCDVPGRTSVVSGSLRSASAIAPQAVEETV